MISADLQTIWDFLTVIDQPRKADVIFLFGTQDEKSPLKAAELYKLGYAPKILVSGGFGPFTKDKLKEPEAVVFGSVLEKLGVPSSAIILETKATNTGENISFGMEVLADNDLSPRSVILVSRPYMMKRILSTFKKLYPSVETISCPSDNTLNEYVAWMDEHIPDKAAARLKAEIERLIEYPQRGFMVEVSLPDDIRGLIDVK